MVLRRVLGRLAAAAPARVFAVAGAGAREAVQDLRLVEELRLVDTPRAADVLLVAGAIPEELSEPLAQVHDTMAHPRCTVFWPLGVSAARAPRFHSPVFVEAGGDVVAVIRRAHRDLFSGARATASPILPDVDAAPWRGVGPYGQGGSGMTGGTPYGRPMAELAPDRDGLRLDALPVRIGPFFPRFPAGLSIDLKLAGDIVVDAAFGPNPIAAMALPVSDVRPGLRPFLRALSEPAPIVELELTRAREHLRWLADGLLAHQLGALGLRVLRLAARVGPGDGAAIRKLAGNLRWTQVFGWSTAGVGPLRAHDLAGLGAGPVARAAGVREDVRTDDPAYQTLGFEPIVQEGGDASARWRQRLAEAAQSLDLAARAGSLQTGLAGRVESPRGRLEVGSSPTERVLPVAQKLIDGLEWGDAMATLMSLDLDFEEAGAARSMLPREVEA